jgi:hypothetical protein
MILRIPVQFECFKKLQRSASDPVATTIASPSKSENQSDSSFDPSGFTKKLAFVAV